MRYFRCWSVRNLLDLYGDGRLSPAASGRVEAHLSACARCREAADEFAGLKRLLRGVRRPLVPEGLAAAVLESARSAKEAPESIGGLRWEPAQALALAVLVLVAGTHGAGEPSRRGPGRPPTPREAGR